LIFLLIHFVSSCTKEPGIKITDTVTVDDENFSYVLFDGLTQSILTPIQTKLDDNYSRVLSDLDVVSMNKVTVKIWNNETNFLDDMQRSLGISYPGASGWVYNANDIRILNQGNGTNQIVLHEFCHAVSLVVNPQFGNNPRWLWEAVAIYESGEFVDPQTISYLVEGNFPTISELNSDFNGGDREIYRVGYLLAEYIIFNWGNNSYVNLIKSNGNILQTLGISTQEFEGAWKNFVIEKYLN